MRFSDMMGSGAENSPEPDATSEPGGPDADASPDGDVDVAARVDAVAAFEPAVLPKTWVPERAATTPAEYAPLSDDLLPRRR
jgi:hypothetical protein